MPNKTQLRPQEIKQPRKVLLATHVRDMLLVAFVFGSIGLVSGWFLHTNMTSDARASVHADMALTKKAAN